jgi:hypothetical protein
MQNLYVKKVTKADRKGLKAKTEVYRKAPYSIDCIDSAKYILKEIHTKNIHQLIKDEIVKIKFFIVIPLCTFEQNSTNKEAFPCSTILHVCSIRKNCLNSSVDAVCL